MSAPNISDELSKAAVEPLLPIELTLIKASLGTGIALLVVLGLLGKYVFPV